MQDYQKEFKNHCLTCKNYDISSKSDSTQRGYRCTHHHRPMAMDEHCSSYSFAAARSNRMIDEAVEWRMRRGYTPGPDKGHWYITTALCTILGLDENCEYLTNYYLLRDTYMRSTHEGREFLANYEVYGPLIAYEILGTYSDPDKKAKIEREVKEVLEPDFLVTINELIKAGRYECAMLAYMQMTDMLAQRYSVFMADLEFEQESIDAQGTCRGRRFCSVCE